MNKRDLTIQVSEAVGNKLSKAICSHIIECILSSITAALMRGESIKITGFGTLKVTGRAARRGRNPQTGEKINIPARKTVRFKPAKLLKAVVNR
ncbi:HU family DNA-binding protein [Dethiosulfatarculus sandiegensis]|uniref:DNA-binding protein n=1 Tax=Dethiosulfatarculus sandiegensis TaxID=1429043 RepID=A0A0D2JZM8_9BACT|nr:DNA-binding protein [Dethiosulfatarculus sandiegensis]